jgi:HicB family
VVTRPPADDFGATVGPSMTPSMASVPAVEEEGPTARINFRPPEHLKARIEAAAARDGLSVNAWLVRVTSGVLGGPTDQKRPSGGQSFS